MVEARSVSRRGFLRAGAGVAGVAALGGGLAACASDGGSGAGAKTINFNNKSLEIFFYEVLLESVKRATKQAGRKLTTSNANNDASAQFNNWQSALVTKPEFIVSNPVDSSNLIELSKKSAQRDIPVGVIDTPMTSGEVAFTIAFDNRLGGVLAAQATVEALKKKYGSARGIVLDCYGTLQSSALADRRKGFDETIRKYPDITLLSRPTQQSLEQTRSLVTSTISQYPKLDAIHTPTDSLTPAALASMKAAGRLTPVGAANHIILTSIDGDPNGLSWLTKGWLDADVSQDPVAYGKICVEMLVKYSAKGKKVPLGDYTNDDYTWEKAKIVQGAAGPQMVLPPFTLTKKDAADERLWGNVVTKKWGMKVSTSS